MSEPEKTENPAQFTTAIVQQFWYKNRLQEYAQKSVIPMPTYKTVNDGSQHEPKFRSTVLVDGTSFTSPNTFSHRKAAEQDAARFALLGISQKIKDEGAPLIHEDTVFCKSILNEYAVKMNLETPTFKTIQTEGLLPVFVSSLVFNNVNYTGGTGRNKKEAEQLAARAVILSILDSESGTVVYEIIKSKLKLYAALNKVKESGNILNGNVSGEIHTEYSLGIPLRKRKDIEVAGSADDMAVIAIPGPCSEQPANILATHPPLHEFRTPKSEVSSEAYIPPIVFVPPVMEQSLDVASTSGKKRTRKNKKKARKKMQVHAPLRVA